MRQIKETPESHMRRRRRRKPNVARGWTWWENSAVTDLWACFAGTSSFAPFHTPSLLEELSDHKPYICRILHNCFPFPHLSVSILLPMLYLTVILVGSAIFSVWLTIQKSIRGKWQLFLWMGSHIAYAFYLFDKKHPFVVYSDCFRTLHFPPVVYSVSFEAGFPFCEHRIFQKMRSLCHLWMPILCGYGYVKGSGSVLVRANWHWEFSF